MATEQFSQVPEKSIYISASDTNTLKALFLFFPMLIL